MLAFWRKKKPENGPKRYMVTYKNKNGVVYQVGISSSSLDRARKAFLSYYSLQGDEITDIVLLPGMN